LISFYCDDRPGVIEDLSGAVERCRGNWLDSQLARLGGRFAGVLHAQIPVAQQAPLHQALADLADAGITATMTTAGDAPAAAATTKHLTVLGPDRPGIVHELTRALSAGGFNVLSMSTAVESAPMSGEALFRAEAIIEVPDTARLETLAGRLDAMAETMTLEIDLVDR
jgi:glycine cleavage system regulatory protein